MRPDLIAEISLNWLAAAAGLVYLLFMLRRPTQSGLEKRLVVLLLVIVIFLAARGAWWLSSHPVSVTVTNVAISCIPLMLVIFVEGLLRRHAPFALKCFTTVATACFIFISLFVGFTAYSTYALLAYEILVLLSVFGLILSRDKASLSESENHLITLLGITALLALPLFVSDFQTVLDLPVLRLGSISIFIFIYIFIRQSSGVREVSEFCKELGLILFRGFIIGIAYLWLSGISDMYTSQAQFALGIGLSFFISIVSRLSVLRREARTVSFQKWLSSANIDSSENLIQALGEYTPLRDATLVGNDDMRRYDNDKLNLLFKAYGTLLSIRDLQRIAGSVNDENICFAAEQLIDLLNRNESNQFCLLSRDPLFALLVNVPQVSGTSNRNTELIVINKIAESLSGR